jgi:hypothetical protein
VLAACFPAFFAEDSAINQENLTVKCSTLHEVHADFLPYISLLRELQTRCSPSFCTSSPTHLHNLTAVRLSLYQVTLITLTNEKKKRQNEFGTRRSRCERLKSYRDQLVQFTFGKKTWLVCKEVLWCFVGLDLKSLNWFYTIIWRSLNKVKRDE